MDIRVSGHQVDTGDALRQHVEERLTALAEKYFPRAISARATFGKGPYDHSFICDIVIHPMQDLLLKGSAQASEAHPAFDLAADKIEKQLRRYHKRLNDRSAQHEQARARADAIDALDAGYTVFSPAEEEEAADNPPIIAETKVDIPEVSVSDAVMLLDLRNTGALFFRNSGTGSFNMVYRRDDGTIGWVEPRG